MKKAGITLMVATLTWGLAQGALAEEIRVELTDPTKPAEVGIEIEWGSIRIQGNAAATGLTIEAVPDRPGEVAGGLFTAREEGNVVTVRQAPLRPGSFASVHLEVEIPLRASLHLVVHRGGDVRVEGVHGLIEVTNLNGSVDLADVAGAAAVNASNGAITASFTAVDRGRDMIFASLNGSVELCLPPTLSGRVHLTTAGDPIRSEFRIEPERAVRTVAPGGEIAVDRSEVRGRIGPGEALLRASTLNGEVNLKLCKLSRPRPR